MEQGKLASFTSAHLTTPSSEGWACLPECLHQPSGPACVRAVILLELGQVLGPAHVNDPDRSKAPAPPPNSPTATGAGLALPGTGPWVPRL